MINPKKIPAADMIKGPRVWVEDTRPASVDFKEAALGFKNSTILRLYR
jgi:hypothetical protein